jgi:hypothetical protein
MQQMVRNARRQEALQQARRTQASLDDAHLLRRVPTGVKADVRQSDEEDSMKRA